MKKRMFCFVLFFMVMMMVEYSITYRPETRRYYNVRALQKYAQAGRPISHDRVGSSSSSVIYKLIKDDNGNLRAYRLAYGLF